MTQIRNLVVSNSPQQILSALGSHKVEIQNKLVVEHVFLVSVVCSSAAVAKRNAKYIASAIMTLTVVVVLTSRTVKLRKTVHVKRRKKRNNLTLQSGLSRSKSKMSVKLGNHCMQLTVAIKTKEVGIGWPWVKGTGELPNIQRENVTIFAPPPPPPPLM